MKTKLNKYDYIIIGSGFSGAVHAERLSKSGFRTLVLEKRDHIGGNCYTEKVGKIDVHKYSSHIFHTNNEKVWKYINHFTDFNNYQHRVIANTGSEHVMLPFTMVTFMQLFNVSTVEEVKQIIKNESFSWFSKKYSFKTLEEYINHEPINFEEQAIKIVGVTIYKKLIKYYTEKQWGRTTEQLPAEIIKRLPLRFNSDTTYFNNAKYTGIPIDGYTNIFERLLHNIEVIDKIDVDKALIEYLISNKLDEEGKIIFTGPIDKLLNYEFGHLEYRSLIFVEEKLNAKNYQGTACVNFTDKFENTPFTRITEHKHYSLEKEVLDEDFTIITKEYSTEFDPNKQYEPIYPIGDSKNKELWNKYRERIDEVFDNKLILSGRLATYQYLDMDKTIEQALESVRNILFNRKN